MKVDLPPTIDKFDSIHDVVTVQVRRYVELLDLRDDKMFTDSLCDCLMGRNFVDGAFVGVLCVAHTVIIPHFPAKSSGIFRHEQPHRIEMSRYLSSGTSSRWPMPWPVRYKVSRY